MVVFRDQFAIFSSVHLTMYTSNGCWHKGRVKNCNVNIRIFFMQSRELALLHQCWSNTQTDGLIRIENWSFHEVVQYRWPFGQDFILQRIVVSAETDGTKNFDTVLILLLALNPCRD